MSDHKLFTLAEAKGNKLLTIEVPANVYKILQDLAIQTEQTLDESLKDIIYQHIDKELGAKGNLDSGLAAFLKRKHNYKPRTAGKKEVNA